MFIFKRDSMKLKLITALFASLFVVGSAFAAEVKKADKDSDGTLDKVEAKAFPKLLKNFEKIDTDSDGTISQAEINAYKLMKADKDHDGTLEKSEIKDKKIVKAFNQIDTDADGTIDAKELTVYFEKS
jgi:Ca2+-binding EF-hand superfamily protein